MKPRDSLIWGSAITLSLLVHLLLFVNSGSRAGAERPPSQQTTRVSFRSVAAPLTPPQEAPQQELKKPEEEVVEAPAPPPKPKPKKKKKVAEKVRQVAPPKPAPRPEPVRTTERAEKPSLPAQQASGTVDDPALLEKTKHEYLRRLMAHIEAHKHYPRVARRRGLEGGVEVSFRLLPGGRVSNMKVAQGHRILRKAVEEAMQSAQPLPVPPGELPLPLAIAFTVQFSLKTD